jgi:molybdopterin-guanine dinucleotide biosynthesis protein A
VRIVPDAEPGLGPLGGIHAELTQSTGDRALILACDMPFLTAPFLAWLTGQGWEADVTVPRDARGMHPLCAVWATTALPVVDRLLDRGVRKVGDALGSLRVHVVEGSTLEAFDPDGWLLHNINTPDDYQRALARRSSTARDARFGVAASYRSPTVESTLIRPTYPIPTT